MNEKQLTRISILGSVISLIAIYIFVSSVNPVSVNIGDITRDYAGKIVNVTGMVKNPNMKNGNAFFTLVDGTGEIRVVIWKSVMQELEMKGVDQTALKENMTISIEGAIDVYQGQLEIVPARPRMSILD